MEPPRRSIHAECQWDFFMKSSMRGAETASVGFRDFVPKEALHAGIFRTLDRRGPLVMQYGY